MNETARRQVLAAIAIGGERATAAAYAGLESSELERAITTDPELQKEIAHAEATAELSHLRTLKQAAEDPKNWRASVWWLRSRQPDRYGRKPDTVTHQDLEQFAEQFFAALGEVLGESELDEVRQRIDRLLEQTS